MARIEADLEDLSTRARIRDAALRHFGEHGFGGASIRGIAEAAGVSSGLVRHHFGSKLALREACDDYLIKTVRRINDEARTDTMLADVNPVAAAQAALGPYQRYLARALTEGWAAPLFDEMARLSEEWLEEVDKARPDPPFASRKARATVATAMSLAVPILHQHISRGLGVDLASPEGAHLLAMTLLDIHSHPMVTPEAAAAMREGLEKLRDKSL
ncbi:TetR family transcriptional regulator [Nonomuraea turkmeniaca]|uniref:TetR family transcriptional regulator n=1 Tax=Nonomuraea turkmeniaca TaxID=103838 RepID=A0A5S4FC42_9ACTN|nr:TetR/AcrR family transcriptional regulator [Nonomuraea turkmeniaca]TMR15686.1 TetR family transcriptional regulator [Nonomuraea turkmeniaca]